MLGRSFFPRYVKVQNNGGGCLYFNCKLGSTFIVTKTEFLSFAQ